MNAEQQINAYKELRQNGQAFFIDNYADADRIIEALEKQIPKKPKRNDGYYGFFRKTYSYTCPTCMNCLLTEMMNERQNTSYCWDCGQKLDWRENE